VVRTGRSPETGSMSRPTLVRVEFVDDFDVVRRRFIAFARGEIATNTARHSVARTEMRDLRNGSRPRACGAGRPEYVSRGLAATR
jgi:hypothetical protein